MIDHGLAGVSVRGRGTRTSRYRATREEDVKQLLLEGMEGVDRTLFVRVAGLTFHLIVLRIVCYVHRSNVAVKDIHSEKNEFYEIRQTMSKLAKT